MNYEEKLTEIHSITFINMNTSFSVSKEHLLKSIIAM